MHPVFQTIAVGNDNQFVVRRTHNGVVSYLASRLDDTVIGRWSLGLAEGTVKVLENSRPTQGEDSGYHWLPWPTDHLPYRKPASMFPPARPHG